MAPADGLIIPQYQFINMLGRVKKWLGIEGVKLEILVPEEIDKRTGQVRGKLRFQSMNTQVVNRVKLVLIEKYIRGKGQEKLIDEYELGAVENNNTFEVQPEEPVEMDFSLPFTIYKSDVDQLEDRNIFARGIARAAKFIRGVKSEYRIEAEAKVKGVALNPFDKKVIKLK